MASKLLKARLKSSMQASHTSPSPKSTAKFTNAKQSKSKSKSLNAGPFKVKPRLLRVLTPQPIPEKTFTGLPWSVRSKDFKYQQPSNSEAMRHGTYTFSYSEAEDDGPAPQYRRQKQDHQHPMITLRHHKTEAPGPSISAKPAFIQPVPIDDQQFVQDIASGETVIERGDDDPYKYRLDNKLIHGYDQLTASCLRHFLLQNGFTPTDCPELLELYRSLDGRQERPPRQQHDGLHLTPEEKQEAAEAFGIQESPRARTKKHDELIRIYGNKLAAKMIKGEMEFPHGFCLDDMIKKKTGRQGRKAAHVPPQPPAAAVEPHPDLFRNPKIQIPLARQLTLIQKQLDEEKRLAHPKMDTHSYDRRRRALLHAAMKAYDSDFGKSTDELLVDLVDTPADKILYHNINQESVPKDEELIDISDAEDESYTEQEPLPPPLLSPQSFEPSSPLTTELASQSLKSIFGIKSAVEPSAMGLFKDGSVAGSVIRQLEAERPDYYKPVKRIVLATKTRFPKEGFVAEKALRTRVMAKQTLANYSITKQKQMDSLQRPTEMRLIAKPN